jgi:hypothetical protein
MLFRYSGLFFQTEKRGLATRGKKAAAVLASLFFLLCGLVNSTSALTRPDLGPMNVQPAAVAIPPIIVTAPTTSKPLGVPFVIPITVSDTTGDGVVLFQFSLVYDPAVIDPVGPNSGCASIGTLSASFTVNCSVSVAGTLEVTGFGPAPLTGSGTLLNLTFTTDAAATGGSVSTLTFGSVTLNGGAVGSGHVNGQVTLTGPTAGDASVSGRVTTHAGNPISGARVSLMDEAGHVTVTLTNPFGYFRFEDVEAGETYVVSVRSKRYAFQPRVVNVGEEVTELNFVAEQ